MRVFTYFYRGECHFKERTSSSQASLWSAWCLFDWTRKFNAELGRLKIDRGAAGGILTHLQCGPVIALQWLPTRGERLESFDPGALILTFRRHQSIKSTDGLIGAQLSKGSFASCEMTFPICGRGNVSHPFQRFSCSHRWSFINPKIYLYSKRTKQLSVVF